MDDGGEGGGFRLFLAFGLGTVLTLLGFALVQAASSGRSRRSTRAERCVRRGAYRLTLDSVRPLGGALVIAVAVVSVLTLSVFLVPIAIWLVVRWALLVPAVELEQHSALGALRRSAALVRRSGSRSARSSSPPPLWRSSRARSWGRC